MDDDFDQPLTTSSYTYINHTIIIKINSSLPIIINNHSSSSSSSSLEFSLKFSLRDQRSVFLFENPRPWIKHNRPPMLSPSQTLEPDQEPSWFEARLALSSLGLEPHYQDQVMRALRSRVDDEITNFRRNCITNSKCYDVQASVLVKIVRFSGFRIRDPLVLLRLLGEDDDGDTAANDDHEARTGIAIQGLQRVIKDDHDDDKEMNSCTICLEKLVLIGAISGANCEDDGDGENDAVKLPNCQHIFHRACIVNWFNKRHYLCPLCRSSCLVDDVN